MKYDPSACALLGPAAREQGREEAALLGEGVACGKETSLAYLESDLCVGRRR